MREERRSTLHESVLRHVHDTVTIVDAQGVVRYVNDGGMRLGHDPAASVGQRAHSWVHPDDVAVALERRTWLLGAPGRTTDTVLRVRQGDGSYRHVETHGVNLLHDPQVQGLLYVTRDVEDRARAEAGLVHALAAQSVVGDLGLRALRSGDVEEVLQDALSRVASVLGTPYVTLLLLDGDDLSVRRQHGPDPLPAGHPWPAQDTQAGAALARRHPVISEDRSRFRTVPEMSERGVVAGLDVLLEGVDGPLGVLSSSATTRRPFSPIDVQFLQGVANLLAGALEREQRERSAVERALHDPLTGLPTRPLFDDRLEHALSRLRRGIGEVAVLLVDLDRFKQVNDSWGHAAGDEVLRTLGPRLAACARASDTVARYGGDEFVVLCEDEVRHVGVSRVAAALRRACAEPFLLPNGQQVLLSGSVGIGWSAEEGPDAAALLRAADAGMYRDKAGDLAVSSR